MLDLYDATISELQQGLKRGDFTSVDLTKAYIARINEVNDEVRAVYCISPKALEHAATLDAQRKEGKAGASLLFGIPLLVKDNVSTSYKDGMDTTAGSLALKGVKVDDAYIVAKLREAGAIILGKAGLSEWAYFRDGDHLPSGWSAIGGQITCPWYKDGNPVGSSGGSGVAGGLALAAGTIGTETNGSIVCPSSRNNCVGLRPTVGLVSRTGIVPVTTEHDSAGPMCRTVEDAAIVLSAIAGIDKTDRHTTLAPSDLNRDYMSYLKKDALKGKKLAVPTDLLKEWGGKWEDDQTLPKEWMRPAFNKALEVLRGLGAEVVEVEMGNIDVLLEDEDTYNHAMRCEFKHSINEYLATLKDCKIKNLSDLVEFNKNTPEERPPSYEGQAELETSDKLDGLSDPKYADAKRKKAFAKGAIDGALKRLGVDAFIMPGVQCEGWSRAGYPQIIVPLGFGREDLKPVQLQDHPAHQTYYNFPNEPFGLTIAGTAWSEGPLLGYAYAFEQATHYRKLVKPYKEAMPTAQIQVAKP